MRHLHLADVAEWFKMIFHDAVSRADITRHPQTSNSRAMNYGRSHNIEEIRIVADQKYAIPNKVPVYIWTRPRTVIPCFRCTNSECDTSLIPIQHELNYNSKCVINLFRHCRTSRDIKIYEKARNQIIVNKRNILICNK